MGPISSQGWQPLGRQQDAKGDARVVRASQPGGAVPQMLPAPSRVLGGMGTGHGPCCAEPWLTVLGSIPGACQGVTTGTPLGTSGLTPGCMALPPELLSSSPAILPSWLPPSPTGTLPGGRCPQCPATCRRDGLQPGEDLCRSLHPLGAPHPISLPPPAPGSPPASGLTFSFLPLSILAR